MAFDLIGIGSVANDGTGDGLRTAFGKFNTVITALNNAGWTGSLAPRSTVRLATAAALATNTYSAGVITASANGAMANVDGVAPVVGDRILVKNESSALKNGIYEVTSLGSAGTPFVLTRAADFDVYTEYPGAIVTVQEGTANGDELWQCTANYGGTLGVTSLTWAQIGAGNIADGDYGDVVVSSSGTVWTIDTNAVSNAKFRQSAALSVVGRASNTTGDVADITAGTAWHLLYRNGSNALVFAGLSALIDGAIGSTQGQILYRNASGWVALAAGTAGQFLQTAGAGANPAWATVSGTLSDGDKGDITVSASGATWTIDANVVSNTKFRQSAALSVVGRSANTTGDVADIAGTANQFLQVSNTNVLGFVTISGDISFVSGVATIGASFVTGKTEDTSPDANADFVLTYDNSATALKKVLLKNVKPTESIQIAVGDETTAITVGNAKVTFRMPYAFTVTAVRASLNTVSSSGTPTVDINEGGVSILSTKLTIDASEKTSTTAATAAVISDTALADDAEMTIDIDTAGTGAKGLKVTIIGYRA